MPDGNLVESVDPVGHVTTTTYDAQGWVSEQTDAAGDPISTTRYDTDAAGRTIQTTVYDADGNVVSITEPDGIVTTTTYDSDGIVTERVASESGQTLSSVTQTYDSDGESLLSSTDTAARRPPTCTTRTTIC